ASFHEAASLLSQSIAKQDSILGHAGHFVSLKFHLTGAMQSFPRGFCVSRTAPRVRHDAIRLHLAHFLRSACGMHGGAGGGTSPDRMGWPRPEPEPACCDK